MITLHNHPSRIVVGISFLIAAAGCATVAPLDDAALIQVGLASSDDLARYAVAQERMSRELFGGASFSDGKGRVLVSFTAAEYDKYLAYTREHAASESIPAPRPKPRWPMLRLVFQSHHVLLDPDASSAPFVVFYLCDSNNDRVRLWGFGTPALMWDDRLVVTSTSVRQMATLLGTRAQPQRYEVFFEYVYSDHEHTHAATQPVTLLGLPKDLCVAMERLNYPFPSSVGRPMRISKDVINAALGPLPRSLSIVGEKSK